MKHVGKTLIALWLLVCHAIAMAAPASSPVQATIVPNDLTFNQENELTLILRHSQTGALVTVDQLEEVHTKKIHLLVINEHGDDYHHLHPVPTSTPGEYRFRMTPNTQDAYRFWVDIALQEQGSVDYFYTDVLGTKSAFNFQLKKYDDFKLLAPGTTVNTSLSFHQDYLIAGSDVMGKLIVTDAQGVVIDRLQPIMGAYAHLVGFYEDGESLAHLHPQGKPQGENTLERGILNFHFFVTDKVSVLIYYY